MGNTTLSRLARVRRAVFARHSNPWSAWTRWATAPLVLVPVWSRRWTHAAAVAAWFAVNPVIFPEPADRRAWATRAMLGEELWILDRPKDAALAVNAIASAAGVAAFVAAPPPSSGARGHSDGGADGTAPRLLGADGALLRPPPAGRRLRRGAVMEGHAGADRPSGDSGTVRGNEVPADAANVSN